MSERTTQSQNKKEAEAAQIARAEVTGGMWNLNVTAFFYVVLAAILILAFTGFGWEVLTVVATFGISGVWLFARRRYRILYDLVYQEQLRRLQETAEETPPRALESKEAAVSVAEPSSLTSRQVEILKCVASGYSNKEIAVRLDLSEQTVKNQLTNIFNKLEVDDRTQAVMTAMRLGWLKVDNPPEQ